MKSKELSKIMNYIIVVGAISCLQLFMCFQEFLRRTDQSRPQIQIVGIELAGVGHPALGIPCELRVPHHIGDKVEKEDPLPH